MLAVPEMLNAISPLARGGAGAAEQSPPIFLQQPLLCHLAHPLFIPWGGGTTVSPMIQKLQAHLEKRCSMKDTSNLIFCLDWQRKESFGKPKDSIPKAPNL